MGTIAVAGQLMTWVVGTAWATGIVILGTGWALHSRKPWVLAALLFWLPILVAETLLFLFSDWKRRDPGA